METLTLNMEKAKENVSLNNEVIEAIVDDWIEKYPLREGNLAINDPKDSQQIDRWIDGVLGRIKHQLLDSGFPMKGTDVEQAIITSLWPSPQILNTDLV